MRKNANTAGVAYRIRLAAGAAIPVRWCMASLATSRNEVAMTMYLCKLVATDDRVMAAQRLTAANDRGPPRKIHPLFVQPSEYRPRTWTSEAQWEVAPLPRDNDQQNSPPDIRGLGYVGAAVLLIALACIGALIPYI
jgi:hypothetical protein